MPKVHLIGICGTAMAALAGMLQERGWRVSGSDAAAYPPMSDLLAARGIKVQAGYDGDRLHADFDLVVVGNVAARDNVEALRARELGLSCLSLPETLWREFLAACRERFVVAGTHGKTTSSALLAWALKSCGREPSFMIGGELLNFKTNYHLGSPDVFVLEGDEYNSSYFDRHAKFHHYRPTGLLLTGIEMDHIDLFSGLEEVKAEFARLLGDMPPSGLLVANADCPVVAELRPRAGCRVLTYGMNETADYRLLDFTPLPGRGRLVYRDFRPNKKVFELAALGRHNAENALGVLALLENCGYDYDALVAGLGSFAGVKRRQEIFAVCEQTVYMSDFAHHPTAIRKTLEALREHYPQHHLLAVFEPRTATSRRALFQRELATAFAPADEVWLAPVYRLEALAPEEVLDTEQLAADLQAGGLPAWACPELEEIFPALQKRSGRRELVVLMSTGAFGGLFARLKSLAAEAGRH